MYTTVISPEDVEQNLNNPDWILIDCRFSLNDEEQGLQHYLEAHLPNSFYAHLNKDLSGPLLPYPRGRHPLPDADSLAQTFSRWGIDANTQVVAYDDNSGAIAARLWWLLRWTGHEKVAVLDGGWDYWKNTGRPTTKTTPQRAPRTFQSNLRSHYLVDTSLVQRVLHDPNYRLLDARAADRYRGENETIDPVAGHIPSAISAPFMENVSENGRMVSQEALRQRFRPLMGGVEASRTICYCGSGVTACHNLLAMLHAGLGDAQLYAGSWSEWITDPDRPIVTKDSQ